MTQNSVSSIQLQKPGAFTHAEICHKTKSVTADLINQDAEAHHVFFNKRGFHNHVIHQVLAAFSLGADEARLKAAYKTESKIQLPKLPEINDFKWDSSHCLGNHEYYASYLNYFLSEIELKGSIPVIEEYVFNPRKTEMFNRFMSGFYHPLIHVGYGVEFGIPLMVAEGLAQTAVHKAYFNSLLGNEIPKAKEGCQKSKHATALEITLATKNDRRFDGIVTFETIREDRTIILAEKIPKVLLEYMEKWVVLDQLDGEEGLRARSTELQALGAALSTGAQPLDKQIHIDFFLMHILTSSLFLHTFIEQLNPVYGASLLRAKFLVDLTLYVSLNRPTINLDQFKTYPSKHWEEIIKAAIAHDDAHVPKAVRAMKHAAAYDKSIEPATYQAMAQMIIDGDGLWSSDGVGFEEVWKDYPARGVKAKPFEVHSFLTDERYLKFANK